MDINKIIHQKPKRGGVGVTETNPIISISQFKSEIEFPNSNKIEMVVFEDYNFEIGDLISVNAFGIIDSFFVYRIEKELEATKLFAFNLLYLAKKSVSVPMDLLTETHLSYDKQSRTEVAFELIKDTISTNYARGINEIRFLNFYIQNTEYQKLGGAFQLKSRFRNVYEELIYTLGRHIRFKFIPRPQSGGLFVDFEATIEPDNVIFSEKMGNLYKATYEADVIDEVNEVVAGGGGEGVSRKVIFYKETTKDPIIPRMAFVDNRDELDPTILLQEAKEEIVRPKKEVKFVVNANAYNLGVDYFVGDKVFCETRYYSGYFKIIKIQILVNSKSDVDVLLELEMEE